MHGIDDGDLVVVRKAGRSQRGRYSQSLVDNQNTLKHSSEMMRIRNHYLHPENKKMKDIIVDECCIQGVACHIIKEL